MTGLAITLYIIKFLLIFVIGILPAAEVGRAVRETLIRYVFPIKTRRSIITVLTVTVLSTLAVAMGFTVPIALFIFSLITGV